MRAISLFTGIGGFDLGFERAGIETVLQVEQDEHCAGVLELHWPRVRRVTDARDVGGADGPADVVHGGFPCQDVSVAGRRAGLAGERSGLWFEFQRCLREIRPRWCLIENVPGLRSSKQGQDFGTVVSGLVELGYSVAWRSLDAQFFGLAQRRERVFIVGSLGDGRAAEVLLEPDGMRGDSAPCRAAREGVTRPLGQGSGARGYRDGDDLDHGALIPFDPAQITSPGNYSNPAPGDPSHPLSAEGGAPLILSQRGREGGSSDEIEYGIAPALRSGGGGASLSLRVLGGGDVRRLTPTECERLQGFPDDWTRWRADGKEQADSHRYRQLGNAVAVPVATWIARRLTGAAAS